MSQPAFVPPKWRKPAPLGYGNAIDSVGSIAAPLLAGFSLASVLLVADDAANFRWPGGAVLALSVAAVLLIGSVQCAFNARQYLWSAADVADWWPDMKADSPREQLLRTEQERAFRKWDVWVQWTRLTYHTGIVALLAALGVALPPQNGSSPEGALRWAAAGVAFAGCAGEVAWILIGSRSWTRVRRLTLPGD